jgi:arsenical pump membrane protein
MVSPSLSHLATWSISGASLLGVITRPRGWSEAWWAVAGALAVVLLSLITPARALSAVGSGMDVYLFLTGMMLLAELARRAGVFEWLAHLSLKHAKGSATRLFLLVYVVGIVVTIFLSNDATAVVLTPAVYAVAKHARVPALPYLLVCAFIANAASFVLPISNPANLVVFGAHMPTLSKWLAEFGAASAASIVSTYYLLRWTQSGSCGCNLASISIQPVLTVQGRVATGAIAGTAVLLLVASVLDWPLGFATACAAVAAWLILSALERESPLPVLRDISWGVLPLVAGLFVLVAAIEGTGAFSSLIDFLSRQLQRGPLTTEYVAAGGVALVCNLVNNLPMGLITATVAQGAHLSAHATGAFLIGVDLGPNLSITGSLATILWLVAIRREGEIVRGRDFLAVGVIVMPASFLLTLAAFQWLGNP